MDERPFAHWVILIGHSSIFNLVNEMELFAFSAALIGPSWSYWREILRISIQVGLVFGAETFMFTVSSDDGQVWCNGPCRPPNFY